MSAWVCVHVHVCVFVYAGRPKQAVWSLVLAEHPGGLLYKYYNLNFNPHDYITGTFNYFFFFEIGSL